MKEKNLAVELLRKLISEQVFIYRRTNVVKSEKFSEIMQRSLNAYLNGMLTNEEVIEEMLKLAKQALLENEKKRLISLTKTLHDRIKKIKTEYPYSVKDIIENPEKAEQKKAELESIIAQYNEMSERYKAKLAEMMR